MEETHMKFADKLAITGSAYFCLIQTLPAYSNTETTTVKTTTVTREVSPATQAPILLPSTTSYILVDPMTGVTKGVFNPNGGAIETKDLMPGLIVIDQSTGKIVATVNSSGQTVDLVSAPAFDPLVSSINAKQSQLNTILTDASNNGSINATQAAALRAQLEKIAADEIVYKQDGILTYAEALSLATRLNDLQDQLVLLGHVPAISPILGPKFMTIDGKVVMVMDDLDCRRMKLSQRVDDEYTAGRLSGNQVSSLKEELDRAAVLESKYKKNGELSPSKKQKVAVKLDNIEAQMNKDVAIINNKRAKIGIRVQ
jgi:hypothetical protein